MTVLFTETFSYSAGTTLPTIDPNWANDGFSAAASTLAVDSGGRLYALNGLTAGALYSLIAPSADYAAEVVVSVARGGGRIYLLFRDVSSGTKNQYRLVYNQGAIRWSRIVNGVATALGADHAVADTANAAYTIRGEVEGNQLRAYVNGVLVSTVTDSTFTVAGKFGLTIYGSAARVDSLTFETLGTVSIPIAFAGSVSNQTVFVGAPFSLNLSANFSGTEPPFAYSLQAGALPAGLSLNSSTGVISGTASIAGVSNGIVIRAVDANADMADSNPFSISVEEAAPADVTPPTLTGTVSFLSITQTSYVASWPAGSDNIAVTGYEYQISSTAGTWTNGGNVLSANITGRTAGATETFYVRAYDAAGNRSTPAISGQVTLQNATAGGTITLGSALHPIRYTSASVLNESGIRATVLDSITMAEVLNTSGVVCSNGIITINDAALIPGRTYHLAIKTANGWLGLSEEVTAT